MVLGSIFWVLITFISIVKKQVTICHCAIEACKNAEAVVIATEWKEFLEIEWEEVYKGMNKPAFVFDGCGEVGSQVGFIAGSPFLLSNGLYEDVSGHYYWPPFRCCSEYRTGIGKK